MSLSSSLHGNQKSQFAQWTGSTFNGLQYQGEKDSSTELGGAFFLCSTYNLD